MILVTDAQMRQALVCIRSLGKNGLKVVAGDSERFALGFYSKYACEKFVYPDPKENEKAFVKALLNFVKKNEVEYIVPIRDKTLLAVLRNRKEFEKHTSVLAPNIETAALAGDKSRVLDFAERIGVPVPKKFKSESVEDLEKIKEFPVIVKPLNSSGSRGLVRCYNKESLIEGYKKCKSEYGELIVEEMIPMKGEEIGYYALYDNKSKQVAFSVHKRIRSFPVSGGPSTVRVSIRHKEIEKYGKKILDALKWVGPAMVEFKVDPKTKTPKLIEVNTRFWGSLALDVASGVDYPSLLHEVLTGRKIGARNSYKIGVKSRWLLPGDMLWFMYSKKNWKNTKEFFKFGGYHYDIVSWDDPMPSFAFFMIAVSYLFSKKKLNYVFGRR